MFSFHKNYSAILPQNILKSINFITKNEKIMLCVNSISSLSCNHSTIFHSDCSLSLTKSSWWYWISYGRARMTTKKKKIKCFFIIEQSMMLFFDRSWNSSLCGSKVPKIFMITTFRFSRHKSRTIFNSDCVSCLSKHSNLSLLVVSYFVRT